MILIEKETLVKALDEWKMRLSLTNSMTDAVVCETLLGVIDLVNDADEVGTEPVRHGQWEWYEDPITSLFPDPDYGWRCSQCKEDAEAIIQRASPTANVFFDDSDVPPKFDYCPNCGAKMDKEEES